MKAIPPAIQTLYHDLVQQVHATVEKVGSLYVRTIKGAEYAYLKQTVGSTRRDIFLGRTDEEAVQERIALIRQEASRAKDRRKIISTLKSAGVPAPTTALGAVLDVLADAGILREAVVVGTAAYQCYPPITGFALPSAALMTQDADLATASLAISADTEGETMETVLRRADGTFAAVPGVDRTALPTSFRSVSGFIVDLVTPQNRRDDPNPVPLPQLRAAASPLQHLRWLISDPIPAAALHGSGIPLRVPPPARFAVHKLIIAQKRGADRPKRIKDLAQAQALIGALRARDPWALADAYQSACEQGKRGWREPIERSLAELGIDKTAIYS